MAADYYNLGAKQLAEHLGLTTPKTIAVVDYLDLRNDSECYKEIKIGKATFKRYSQKAIQRIREALKKKSAEEIWNERAKKSKGVK
ncbi:MAG: hypothetical protein RMH97_03480 [Verrucomicrobiales bacterium]|nr:hypothetical protein [Verrucomicrobiales bacterium]